ncbi:MAG: phage tail protein [Acidobacteriota bacterium]|nr:phage tail protein [Acidobacteriota bacterium]
MATEPFLGEIRAFSFNFPPKGWLQCNGQLIAINTNQALFAILGTTYGGNGTTNFALPNLQGRAPVHVGNGVVLGQTGGVAAVTLLSNQIGHGHAVSASATANSSAAAGNFPATASGQSLYGPSADTALNPGVLSPTGGSQPHNNLQPYLVVNYCIAVAGIFPTRS